MTIVVPNSIRVLMPNGRVTEMKLETYLAGAVVAEMGANAPLEALKAQAVASRTYAAAAHRHAEAGADVCTTAHCQKWKRVDPIVAPEVFRAVSETWGTVAAFDGKLIDAFFFDHCDGHTRGASDVHMSPAPYLQSVSCDCGFVALNGHGVGLCQRGAIVMARRGATFEDILQHYYCYVAIVHTSRDRADGKSVRATPSVPSPAHSTQTPAHGKRPKAPPASAHKGKIAHKPIPPRRSAPAKVDKPKEEPAPVKHKAPPPLPPLPPFLMKKAEAEKRPGPNHVPLTPPPSPQETRAEQASPVETPPALPKIESQQTPAVLLPSVETTAASEEQRPALAPSAVEEPRAELLPPVAPALVEPSEPVAAAPAEPAAPVAATSEPVESTPVSETVTPADVVAQASSEPVEKALGLQAAAEPRTQTQTEIEIKPEAEPSAEAPIELQVPAYVAGLNNPSLLAELPPEAPVAEPLAEPMPAEMSAPVEPLAEPLQEVPTPAEPPSEPCAPDTLPELTLPTLKMGKPVRVHIDHLPGERMIAGCLSVPGIMITVLDQRGNETLVMSGSAPHYGEGGFETVVEEDGCYVVWIDGEAIKLDVHCDTAFIHII